MQPESELGASKRKQTQINASNFAFFYLRLFFRFETFQWVTADSNKKKFPSSRFACEVVSETPRRVCPFLLGHLGICGFPSGKVYGGIADQPRICSLQLGCCSERSRLANGLNARGLKMANYWRSPAVGFSLLSDRLPEISFRRTPRNARFRRDVAIWNMTLWSQNSSVGPLSNPKATFRFDAMNGWETRESGLWLKA